MERQGEAVGVGIGAEGLRQADFQTVVCDAVGHAYCLNSRALRLSSSTM